MFPSTHDVYMTPRGPAAALWAATTPLAALARGWHWLRRRHVAARAWRAAARAAIERADAEAAAREACAMEGAHTEFAVMELDGRRFGAVYIDGRLNCLLPDAPRL